MRTYVYSPDDSPGELATAWRNAGFKTVQDAMLTFCTEFASFDDYRSPGKVGSGADYMHTLSADEQIKLRDTVRLAYLDGDPDGIRSYAATAWALEARNRSEMEMFDPGQSLASRSASGPSFVCC